MSSHIQTTVSWTRNKRVNVGRILSGGRPSNGLDVIQWRNDKAQGGGGSCLYDVNTTYLAHLGRSHAVFDKEKIEGEIVRVLSWAEQICPRVAGQQ